MVRWQYIPGTGHAVSDGQDPNWFSSNERVAWLVSKHCLPPFEGAGLSHDRDLLRMP